MHFYLPLYLSLGVVQGKRTDALLEHGLHGRVPYWYDVQAYPGMMFVSSLPLPMGAAAAIGCLSLGSSQAGCGRVG